MQLTDAELTEPISSSSSSSWSHVNGDITLSTSSQHPVGVSPSSWTPQSTTAGTLHDLKKRRSRELQLRLFGAKMGANGADLTSTDHDGTVHASLSVAEIYGHSNSSLPQRQNRLVQAAAEHCCRLM